MLTAMAATSDAAANPSEVGSMMRIINRVLAMSRTLQLNRQFKEVERAIAQMPPAALQQLAVLSLRELAQAGRSEYPHLYGTPPEQRYAPWGAGTDIGISRVRSDNAQVRMRGIALWIAVAYHETKESPVAAATEQHRQILRVLRQLKGHIGAGVEHADSGGVWPSASGAAA